MRDTTGMHTQVFDESGDFNCYLYAAGPPSVCVYDLGT